MSQLDRKNAMAMARCAVPGKKYDRTKKYFRGHREGFAGTPSCPVWARRFRRKSTVAGYKTGASQAPAMRNAVSDNSTGSSEEGASVSPVSQGRGEAASLPCAASPLSRASSTRTSCRGATIDVSIRQVLRPRNRLRRGPGKCPEWRASFPWASARTPCKGRTCRADSIWSPRDDEKAEY